MFWFAVAIGGVLGVTIKAHGMPALERILPPTACRQVWDQRLDGFVAGLLTGLGLQIGVAMLDLKMPGSMLGLLVAFSVASTMPCASLGSLAARVVRGVVAAAAGLVVGAVV